MDKFITSLGITGDKAVAIDDTILTRKTPSTAGSKMLENFVSLFEAEAVTRLEAAGYEIAGKANVGEFGLDVLGETSFFGSIPNAAELVSDGTVGAALCVDVNGCPRRAAAVTNTVFIKPTYGTVSRYGIIPCACSAEQIGVAAKTAKACAEILSVISGYDSKDGTSIKTEKYNYSADLPVSGKKIGIPVEFLAKADAATVEKTKKLAAEMSAQGASVEEFSLPEIEFAAPAYLTLLAGETCNNLSRYDGVKFGHRSQQSKTIDDLYTNSRTEAFGLLTKFIILHGSHVLSQGCYDELYDKSLRVRRVLKEKLQSVFGKYDLLLTPACSKTAYSADDFADELKAVYNEMYFSALASITGIPAIAAGGVQLMADSFCENKLFSAAAVLEGVKA